MRRPQMLWAMIVMPALLSPRPAIVVASDVRTDTLWLDSIKPPVTEQTLIARFGAANVRRGMVASDENPDEPGTVLFPDDPHRTLEFLWTDRAHAAKPETVRAFKDANAWYVAPGVHLGTTMRALERLNGRPFRVSNCGCDGDGTILNWNGGKLEARFAAHDPSRFRVVITLESTKVSPAQNRRLRAQGEFISSSNAALRDVQPVVRQIVLLPRE